MKNVFKFGFAALAISLSVAACQSTEKTGESADTTLTDTSAIVTSVDTTVTDSVAKDTAVTTTTTETPAH